LGEAGEFLQGFQTPTVRIAIETSGCSYNEADSEALAALLELQGHAVVNASDQDSDVVVLNTCTVKDASFRSFEQRLDQLTREGRTAVVAGCIPSAYPSHERWKGRVVVGVNNLTDIVLAVEAAAQGEGAAFLDGEPRSDRLDLPFQPRHAVIDVVPINQGCLSHCAFCETKLARGGLVSFPVSAIVGRIKAALDRGVKEIWLTSQDTATYGKDLGLRLSDLLAAVQRIPGEFRVRLGMANPLYLRGQWEALAEALESPNFFRFAHLPVQSGSDAVLSRMKRGHRPEDWIRLCEYLCDRVEDLTIATDVIVGFPGETDTDFEATLQILDTVRPAVVNRSKFSARPLTAAARMTPVVPGPVVRNRSVRLDRKVKRLARASLSELAGRPVSCLIDRQRRAGSVLARTDSYRPVAIPLADDAEAELLLGRFAEVRIDRVENWHLVGAVEDPADLFASRFVR